MKRLLVVFTVLSLVLPILLTACGGDEKETYTATPIATATATSTATTITPTPRPSGPVKIGVTSVWSGPAASAGFLADQVLNVVEKK